MRQSDLQVDIRNLENKIPIPTRLHRNPSPYTRVRYFIMEIIRVFVTVVHRPEITRLLYELV